MNKTITILKNCTQETLIIISQNVIDISKLKTGFADIRDLIVEEEVIDVSEQKPSRPLNHFERSDNISLDSQGFMDPCYQDHVIERDTGILCTRFEIPSSKNTGLIMSACNGATA